MPPAIIAVAAMAATYATAAAVTGAVIAGVTIGAMGAMFIGGLVGMAVAMVGSKLIGSPSQPDISAYAQGILLNKAGNAEPIPVIYGSRRVGGCRVFMETAGGTNEYLHVVMALCEGPVSAINTVYLNDIPSTDARFSGFLTINKHLGADDQAADSDLMAACASWTADHRLRGVAYIYVRMTWNQTAFPGGLPVFTADVDGRTVLDPRDSIVKFSHNPALCIRDYLTNTRYGRGIPAAGIDDDACQSAANYSEESVTVGGVVQARYTCDGIINVDASALANTNNLLSSCRGMLVFSGGLYRLIIDKPSISTFDFTEDNITGAWTISQGSKKNMFNRIRARFFNPEKSWETDIAPIESTALRAQDNGVVLETQIDLPFTADSNTAKQITTINLNQSRQQIACQFTAFLAGLRCEVGGVAAITHSTPGWAAKKFRILNMSLKNNDEVIVTAREYADAVYDFGTIPASDPAPNTNLPDLSAIGPPTGLTATEEYYHSGNEFLVGFNVSWNPPADAFVSSYDVEYKLSSASDWTYATNTKARFAIIRPLAPGSYNIRVRAINTILVPSTWATVNATEVGFSSTSPVNYQETVVNPLEDGQLAAGALPPLTPSPTSSIAGEVVTISWADCRTTLNIAYYRVNGVNVGPGLKYQQRINWVGTQAFNVIAVDVAGNQSGTGAVNVTTPTVPAATAITAIPRTYAIALSINYPTFDTFAAVEIWAAAANDRTQAAHIGDATSGAYLDGNLPLLTTRYYWVRLRDVYGNAGSWYPSGVNSGIEGRTSEDVTNYYDYLNSLVVSGDQTPDPFIVGLINGVQTVGLRGDLLIDGAILARMVGANEIIANVANLKDAIVETAKIKNLNVTTLKIADQAVTIPVSAFTAAQLVLDNTYQTLQSAAITSDGSPIQILFSYLAHMNGGGGLRLYRDATQLTDNGLSNVWGMEAGVYVDQPAAGTYTYYLKALKDTDGTGWAYQRALSLMLVKK